MANAGHVIGNARWEAGNVRDVLEYYAAAPERQSGRQIPVPGGIDVTFHEPLGVVGIIVPWNFPMAIAGWGFAPGAGRRQHGRAQAGRADPAQRAAHRRARARGRAARGRPADPARQGQRGRRSASSPTPPCARCASPARPRWGATIMAGCAAADQAGHARARGQERQHRLCRRRPRAGGGPGTVRGVRQRGAGLLRPLAHPGRASRLRALHGAARARGRGRRRR